MRIPARVRQRSTDWVLQFINIVFLLLLYFLVNGTISESIRPDIILPMSINTLSGTPPHNAVYADKTGELMFKGAVATPVVIIAALGRGRPVTIVADKTLAARSLLDILDMIRKAGGGEMTLVTTTRKGS
jgi:biopolymer transport protein ExbD